MNEFRIEHEKPVTNVSVHQIAEPAILHSDQPSLIADPSDHTPPRPTPNSAPPSRTYRLTLTAPRLSELKRRRDDMGKWKREPKRKEKASVRRNRPSQRARTKAHTQVDPRRHKWQAEETHTTRDESRSVHHKQPEGCSYTHIHVLTYAEVVNESSTG